MPSELHEFAIDTLRKRKTQYIETPQLIIENYNNELQNINSYNGRQLLEMLQNADDASGKPGVYKKVLINLENGILSIANNGHPFSIGGLESILFSSLSQKSMEQNMIGQKGLGFRSILSWSEEVTISSGELNLVFSKQKAVNFLEEIYRDDSSIKTYLASKTNETHPIAILRVPTISYEHPPLTKIYNTVITIKLMAGIEQDVQNQIKSLVDNETLLFLNHLEEIEINSPEWIQILTKQSQDNKQVITKVVNKSGFEHIDTWNINELKGNYLGKNYELKIAWTDDMKPHSGTLHSYFKTADRFEFPGLVHGTFELGHDRNHLIKDPAGLNQFLVGQLAHLLIDTATKIAKSESVPSYKGLKILAINYATLGSVFSENNFSQQILKSAKVAEIFPTVNSELKNYGPEIYFYEDLVIQTLQGDDVNQLLMHTDDPAVIQVIKSLGINYYKLPDFAAIINRRLHFDPVIVALLIQTLLTTRRKEIQELGEDLSLITPIFPDQTKTAIPWNKLIFLPTATEDEQIDLPVEVEAEFLSRDVADHMLKLYGLNDYEYLDSRLTPFVLRRFTFEAFTDILEKVFLSKPTADNVIKFHQNLYDVRKKQFAKGHNIQYQGKYASLKAVNRKLEIFTIGELYCGSDYGANLTESLLGFDQKLFLASPEQFGMTAGTDLEGYFRWLGVNVIPNVKTIKISEGHPDYYGYKEFFLTHFNYNTSFKGTTYINRQQATNGITAFHLSGIDNLDRILSYADHRNILLWIKDDHTLKAAIEELTDYNTQPMLETKATNTLTNYKGMPNYLKWKFRSAYWLPYHQEKIAPEKCCINKKLGELLSPLLVFPTINEANLRDMLNLNSDGLTSLLRIVGVNNDVGGLDINQLYNMLLKLRYNDKDGSVAKSLYREILSYFPRTKLDRTNEAYRDFTNNGYVLCTLNGQVSYQPVSYVRYLDTKKYGSSITSEFHLIAVDRKQGVDRVKDYFGVEPLNDLKFTINGKPVEHTLNSQFQNELRQFIGLVYGLMVDKDSSEAILRRLKKMRVMIVTALRGEYHSVLQNKTFSLEDFDFITTGEDSSPLFYIKVPPFESSLQTLRAKLNFAEALAEIFSTLFKSEQDRSFIRELYSRNPQDREELFFHEVQTDGPNKLHRSRNLLNLDTDQKVNFWRAVFYSKNINMNPQDLLEPNLTSNINRHFDLSKNTITYLLKESSFLQTGSYKFITAVYDLVSVNNLDLKLFQDRFIELDFSELFSRKISHWVVNSQTKFSYALYMKLKDSDNTVTKSKYFDIYNNYTNLQYSSEEGFIYDLKSYFEKRISKDFGIVLDQSELPDGWDVNKLYEQNLINFKQETVAFTEQIQTESSEISSLILFGEYEQVKKILEEKSELAFIPETSPIAGNQVNKDIIDSSFSDISRIMDQHFEYGSFAIETISETNSYKGSVTPSSSYNNTRTFTGIYVNNGTEAPEKIGFMAEKLVYEVLKASYPDETVVWKSENGRRSGMNIIGAAGYGYDIEYTLNDKLIFVEVKCIVRSELGFKMTTRELDFALNHRSDYEVITVENISQTTPIIRRYPELFLFDESETLLNNHKFSIQNDEYRIRFINQS